MPSEMVFEWQFDIPLRKEAAWAFASNTEEINRLAGIFNTRTEYVPDGSGGVKVRVRAFSRGMKLEYIEEPAQWHEPEYYEFIRNFVVGPFKQMRVHVSLEDMGESTRIHHRVTVQPKHLLGRLIAKIAVGKQTREGFERAYAFAEEWAKHQDYGLMGKPAAAIDPNATRRLTSTLGPVRQAGFKGNSLYRLEEYLNSAVPTALVRMRPYELADRWHIDREEVLELFLHATKAGIFDLYWQVLCPSCRREKGRFASLKDLEKGGHCETCNIDFGNEFDRSIEAVFDYALLKERAEQTEYCHFSPGNTPHQVFSQRIEPGESLEFTLALENGQHQFHCPQNESTVFFEVLDQADLPDQISMSVSDTTIEGIPQHIRSPMDFTVKNVGEHHEILTVSRTRWADDAVTAAAITSLQEFRNLFGSQILAPGAEFSIRNMVFLFSDLVGSTAMYEDIGDATAFSLVREHFDVLRDIYESHHGSLVKTIGDAVMAVFRDPVDALHAALEMHTKIDRVRDDTSGHVLALKIGLHQGPCIAMEANGLIDYFGSTVNTAARVQGKADGCEVALSDSLMKDRKIQAILESAEYRIDSKAERLKGIPGDFMIHYVTHA